MMKERAFLRSARNYDVREASDSATVKMSRKMMTQQHQKDETDINVLMARFGKTGMFPMPERLPLQEDFADIFDFQSAMNAVVAAKEAFMALPAQTRSRFANDPQKYVEFCTEKDDKGGLKNIEELRKLGLAKPAVPIIKPEPMEVRVINPKED